MLLYGQGGVIYPGVFFMQHCANAGMAYVCPVLQGIDGGGLAPVEHFIIVDSFSEKQRPQAFALYGVTIYSPGKLDLVWEGY